MYVTVTIGQLLFVAAKGKNALDCANEIKKNKMTNAA